MAGPDPDGPDPSVENILLNHQNNRQPQMEASARHKVLTPIFMRREASVDSPDSSKQSVTFDEENPFDVAAENPTSEETTLYQPRNLTNYRIGELHFQEGGKIVRYVIADPNESNKGKVLSTCSQILGLSCPNCVARIQGSDLTNAMNSAGRTATHRHKSQTILDVTACLTSVVTEGKGWYVSKVGRDGSNELVESSIRARQVEGYTWVAMGLVSDVEEFDSMNRKLNLFDLAKPFSSSDKNPWANLSSPILVKDKEPGLFPSPLDSANAIEQARVKRSREWQKTHRMISPWMTHVILFQDGKKVLDPVNEMDDVLHRSLNLPHLFILANGTPKDLEEAIESINRGATVIGLKGTGGAADSFSDEICDKLTSTKLSDAIGYNVSLRYPRHRHRHAHTFDLDTLSRTTLRQRETSSSTPSSTKPSKPKRDPKTVAPTPASAPAPEIAPTDESQHHPPNTLEQITMTVDRVDTFLKLVEEALSDGLHRAFDPQTKRIQYSQSEDKRLLLAWDLFVRLTSEADKHKMRANFFIYGYVFATLLVTVAAVFSTTEVSHDADSHPSAMTSIIIGLGLVHTAFLRAVVTLRPVEKWASCLRGSFRLQSEIYRYRMRVGPYELAGTTPEWEDLLADGRAEQPDLQRTNSLLKDIDKERIPIRSGAGAGAGKSRSGNAGNGGKKGALVSLATSPGEPRTRFCRELDRICTSTQTQEAAFGDRDIITFKDLPLKDILARVRRIGNQKTLAEKVLSSEYHKSPVVHDDDDLLSDMTTDEYIKLRVATLNMKHKQQLQTIRTRHRCLKGMSYLCAAGGSFLAINDESVWAAVSAASAAMFQAISNYNQFDVIERSLEQASFVLSAKIPAWVTGLSTVERASPAARHELVIATEGVVESELSAWLGSIRDFAEEVLVEESGEHN